MRERESKIMLGFLPMKYISDQKKKTKQNKKSFAYVKIRDQVVTQSRKDKTKFKTIRLVSL